MVTGCVEPEAKKAASVNDLGSAQLAAIRQQAAAMAAVSAPGGPRPVALGQPHLGGGIMSEDMRVPDKMVGLSKYPNKTVNQTYRAAS
jgi:hypothetical protein